MALRSDKALARVASLLLPATEGRERSGVKGSSCSDCRIAALSRLAENPNGDLDAATGAANELVLGTDGAGFAASEHDEGRRRFVPAAEMRPKFPPFEGTCAAARLDAVRRRDREHEKALRPCKGRRAGTLSGLDPKGAGGIGGCEIVRTFPGVVEGFATVDELGLEIGVRGQAPARDADGKARGGLRV